MLAAYQELYLSMETDVWTELLLLLIWVSAIKATCHILQTNQFSICNNYEWARPVCNGILAKRIFRFLLPTATEPREFKWHNAMLSHLITLV